MDEKIDTICVWCGHPLWEHADTRPRGAPVPRMPCLGLKSGFVPQSHVRSQAPSPRRNDRLVLLPERDALALMQAAAEIDRMRGKDDSPLREEIRRRKSLRYSSQHGEPS